MQPSPVEFIQIKPPSCVKTTKLPPNIGQFTIISEHQNVMCLPQATISNHSEDSTSIPFLSEERTRNKNSETSMNSTTEHFIATAEAANHCPTK
jgi:hypothetical protein